MRHVTSIGQPMNRITVDDDVVRNLAGRSGVGASNTVVAELDQDVRRGDTGCSVVRAVNLESLDLPIVGVERRPHDVALSELCVRKIVVNLWCILFVV
jgi:hypothetical protein